MRQEQKAAALRLLIDEATRNGISVGASATEVRFDVPGKPGLIVWRDLLAVQVGSARGDRIYSGEFEIRKYLGLPKRGLYLVKENHGDKNGERSDAPLPASGSEVDA